ncbi:MAG: GGDEF domain-containing protein [Lachnospiraceae bacterium]|nr:GGDEF domain-containing protein [Lachnospiraceae bacterium]
MNNKERGKKYKTALQKRVDILTQLVDTDRNQAKREFRQLLKEGKEENNPVLIGVANYYIGLLNFKDGLRANFLAYALKATAMLSATKDYEMLARSYNLLGIAYAGMEDYQMALTQYSAALEIMKRHKISTTTITRETVMNNAAEVYYELGDIKKAIRVAEVCLNKVLAKKSVDDELVIILAGNLSEYYEILEDYERASESLRMVKKLLKKLDDEFNYLTYYARKTSIEYARGNIKKGNECADKTIELISSGCDSYMLHRDYERIAHAQIEIGEYDRADKLATFLWDYAKLTNLFIDKIVANRIQAHYYYVTKDEKRALGFYKNLDFYYIERDKEQRAAQLEVQKKTEAMNREVKAFMRELKKQEKLIDRDPMTKLYNRNALPKIMNEFIDTAAIKNKRVGAIFVDIDYFKQYNDTYGHAKGDDIIRSVSDVCLDEECSTVKFARYGGDEFFGVLLGYSDDQISEIARRIARTIRDMYLKHSKNPNGERITLSMGLVNVVMKDTTRTILDIVNYADKAAYHAKNNGKNSIWAYDLEYSNKEKGDERYVKIEF